MKLIPHPMTYKYNDIIKDIKYNIGEIVYLRTDVEQMERIVTGITIRPSGLLYSISEGVNESSHFDFEITREKDIIKITSN